MGGVVVKADRRRAAVRAGRRAQHDISREQDEYHDGGDLDRREPILDRAEDVHAAGVDPDQER